MLKQHQQQQRQQQQNDDDYDNGDDNDDDDDNISECSMNFKLEIFCCKNIIKEIALTQQCFWDRVFVVIHSLILTLNKFTNNISDIHKYIRISHELRYDILVPKFTMHAD